MVGVFLAVAFNPLTSLFTSIKRKAVIEVAESTKTGTATTVLSGMALGMEASVWSLVAIVVALSSQLSGLLGPIADLYALWCGHDRYRYAVPHRQ